jgi:hypothetical protein
LRRLAAVRPDRHRDVELRGTLHALRAVTRRVQQLTAEERVLAGEIATSAIARPLEQRKPQLSRKKPKAL